MFTDKKTKEYYQFDIKKTSFINLPGMPMQALNRLIWNFLVH